MSWSVLHFYLHLRTPFRSRISSQQRQLFVLGSTHICIHAAYSSSASHSRSCVNQERFGGVICFPGTSLLGKWDTNCATQKCCWKAVPAQRAVRLSSLHEELSNILRRAARTRRKNAPHAHSETNPRRRARPCIWRTAAGRWNDSGVWAVVVSK